MPPRMRFIAGRRAKDIDLILPGLGVGEGRNKDRFRVSSETTDHRTYAARQQMVRELAGRLLFPLLRARLEGRFSTTALYVAYRSGDAALEQLASANGGKLLEPLLEQFTRESAARGKEKTEKQIRRFLETIGGEKATTDAFSRNNVASFLADLTSLRGEKPRDPAPATVNRYRAALQSFATWLVRAGYLAQHPIAHKAVPKRDEGDHRMPEFSAAEYRDYFAAVAAERPEFIPVYRLLIHTGADVGEVLSRTVRDFSLDSRVVRARYRRTKTRTPERFVPVPSEFVAELRGHIAAHKLAGGDLMFGMFNRGAVEYVHQRARTAISRPDLRLKDFRHVAAISWRQAGLDLQTIRDWLGHATINQTVIYSAYAPNDALEAPAVEKAAAMLSQETDVLRLPIRAVS